jgi:hypothetical protein
LRHAVFGYMLGHIILPGLICVLIWKVLRTLTPPEALTLVAVYAALIWLVFKDKTRSHLP